ncbi:DUF2490 domain-containing protein [Nafulsella turpanensis]|uniref:DUF2490 domain-containing protein n=1 Tax=Nafulsella turpanensis TaxID=1265690 RepID=UPI0004767612|nr:DUF2490 domain-containing protein [Nafulsella turpanensis]
MKKYLLLLLFLGATQLQAQTTGEEELGNWLMLFGNAKLSDQYNLHAEAQLRLYEPLSNFNQLLLRVGLGRKLSPQASVMAGYGYIPTSSFDKEEFKSSTIEHRIWEQLVLTNQLGRLYFEHRYRIEQRWISSTLNDKYLNRLRYRLLVNIPLNHAELTENTLFATFYDEVFLNVVENPFDQNRLYAALGYKFNAFLSLQAGYLRHKVSAGNLDRLQLALFLNMDFRRSDD